MKSYRYSKKYMRVALATVLAVTAVAPTLSHAEISTTEVTSAYDVAQLEAGYYTIGTTLATEGGNVDQFQLTYNTPLHAEVEVTEAGEKIVTLYINRNIVSASHIDTISVQQDGQNIPVTITDSLPRVGDSLPQTIQLTVSDLTKPLTIQYNFSQKISTTIREDIPQQATLSFDATTITKQDAPSRQFEQRETLADGVYDVSLASFMSGSGFVTPTAGKATVAEQATLEVINGKYYVTATVLPGVNTENSQNNYELHNINSILHAWTGTEETKAAQVAVNDETHETTIRFEIRNPYDYAQLISSKYYYDRETPASGGTERLYLKIDPTTITYVAEAPTVDIGNYKAVSTYRTHAMDITRPYANTFLAQEVAVEVTANKKTLTVQVLDNEESLFDVESFSSALPYETLKAADGSIYALQFTVDTLQQNIPLTISGKDKITGQQVTEQGSIVTNFVTLEKLDAPLPLREQTKHVPTAFPYEDGEYTIDVTLLRDVQRAPFTKELGVASNEYFIEDTRVVVKDGTYTVKGTIRNNSAMSYTDAWEIEDVYGDYTFTPFTMTKKLDVAAGVFNQEFEIEVDDLSAPTRVKFNTYRPYDQKLTNSFVGRLLFDLESVAPFEANEVAGEELPYTLTAAGNGAMDDFVVNYLNPYFEKPATLKEEDGQRYAYITITGKMYIADTILYTDAEGNEKPVTFVSDNGKEGLDRVRVIKFPVHNETMKLYVDGDTYGQYHVQTNFVLKEDVNYTIALAPDAPPAPIDIAAYLGPYFEKPAEVYKEDGQYYANITFNGKMYIANELQYVNAAGEKVNAEIIADNEKEGLDRVYTVKFPLASNVLDIYVDADTYGKYDLRLTFDKDIEAVTPPTEQPQEPEQPVVETVEENVWFTAEHTRASARPYIEAAMQSADIITRDGAKYAQFAIAASANIKLKDSDTYTVVSTKEDGTQIVEVLLIDGYKAVLPFNYYPMPSMPAFVMDNTTTAYFPFETPVNGEVTANANFAIADVTDAHYAKNYREATQNIDVITREDGRYARISLDLRYPIFGSVSGGQLVKIDNPLRTYEVKLNDENEATLTFSSSGAADHVVTYKVAEDAQDAVLYEGFGSYLDVTEKTNVKFVYEDGTEAEAIRLLQSAITEQPYVDKAENAIILGMAFAPTDEVKAVRIKKDNMMFVNWNSPDTGAMQTSFTGAIGEGMFFEVEHVDGTVYKVPVKAFVAGDITTQPEEPAFVQFVEKNVDFQFTTGTDFETGASADAYLRNFVTNADFVIGEDGEPYAEITFGGHSYAIDTLKEGDETGADATIVATTGSVETKDLTRTVRIALDEQYQANVFLGSARGNYTFKFDFIEEKTSFAFTSGTANDAYFSAWVPRADIIEATNGDRYAYITFAGHSYAVEQLLVNDEDAVIVSETGSAETKDLVRVVRVKLEGNKGAVTLKASTHGTYTFNFDFTKATTSWLDALTTEDQAVELTITAGMPAQFIIPGVIEQAQAKKVDDGIQFTIDTTKAESARGFYQTFIVKQGDNVLAEVSAANNETATFTVASIDDVTVDVVYVTPATETAEQKETTYTGTLTNVKIIEQEVPNDEVDSSEYVDGSDLEEAIFTATPQPLTFTYESLIAHIPSAMAMATIVPAATVKKVEDAYEVTLTINPRQTYDFFVTQRGEKVASIDPEDTEETTLTFTVPNLDDLFFYVNGISGSGIETVIGAQVTGYELTPVNPEQPTTPSLPVIPGTPTPVEPQPEQPVHPTEPEVPQQPVVTETLPSTGDVTFDIIAPAAFTTFIRNIDAQQHADGYDVSLALQPTDALQSFTVLQDGEEIASWSRNESFAAKLAALWQRLTATTTAPTVSFTIASLNNLQFVATTTEGELTATVTATAAVEEEPVTHPFTDIAATGHEAEIATLFNAGITTGTSATTFSPGAPITRAQFAVMIARALQVTPTTATTFTDTKGKWYEADIQALKEIGIITGTSDTTFEPGKNITRQQAAVMIHRMLEYKGYVNAEATLSYTDAAKISAYAEEAFAQLQHQQIMTGNNGEISPQASLTRSQMAKILKRALDVSGYEF